MNQAARQIQIDIPGLVMASEIKDDPFAVFKKIIEQEGVDAISVRRVYQIVRKRKSKEDAIKQGEISRMLDMNPGVVRVCFIVLRRAGIPVCTGAKGCWYSWDDLSGTIEHLESRAISELTTAAALKRGLRMREDSRKIEEMLINGLD